MSYNNMGSLGADNRDRLDLLSADIIMTMEQEVLSHVNLIGPGAAAATLLSNVGLWSKSLDDGPNLDGMFPWIYNFIQNEFGSYSGLKSSNDSKISRIATAINNRFESEYPQIVALYQAYYNIKIPDVQIAVESLLKERRGVYRSPQEMDDGGGLFKAGPVGVKNGNEEYPEDDYQYEDPQMPQEGDAVVPGEKKMSKNLLYIGAAIVAALFLLKKK